MSEGTATEADVRTQVAAYLTQAWQCPVTITDSARIFGGASRETWRLTADVAGETRGLVLRRDPPTSLIDTERRLEFGAYRAIYGTGIPVPEPLCLEDDPEWLGQPFSIMAEISDAQTDVSSLTDVQRQQIGAEKWTILGNLSRLDPLALGFADLVDIPSPDGCAQRELDYWAGVIEADSLHPQPIARAAIRWLRAHMPPPAARLAVVHGDYRTGNFLLDPESGIKAILDWEMAHVGDPLEDLAWSLDPLWSWDAPDLAGRLLPPQDAIALWEAASDLVVDPAAFQWWRIMVSVKAIAIWISSSEDFDAGQSKEAILALAGWQMTARQNRILVDYLRPLAGAES